MKLKKIKKMFPVWEVVTVWGKDDRKYLYRGCIKTLPKPLYNLKLVNSEDTNTYFDIRYGCCDCEDHVAVFVKEK